MDNKHSYINMLMRISSILRSNAHAIQYVGFQVVEQYRECNAVGEAARAPTSPRHAAVRGREVVARSSRGGRR